MPFKPKEDVSQQMKVIFSISKHRFSLTFRHMILHTNSDPNDSFQLCFWDMNKNGGNDYVNSSRAILQIICTLPEQSYHYYNIVGKMKLTDDQQFKKTEWLMKVPTTVDIGYGRYV